MKLGGCNVTINCDGRAMREIDTSSYVDVDNTIVCYIASQPGKVSTEM